MIGPKTKAKLEAALAVMMLEARITQLAAAEGRYLAIPPDLRRNFPKGLAKDRVDDELARMTAVHFRESVWTAYEPSALSTSLVPIIKREIRTELTDAGRVAALEIISRNNVDPEKEQSQEGA